MKKLKEKLQTYLKRYSGQEDDEISWQEAMQKRERENVLLVDVRSVQEYEEGHIDGAICVPHYELVSKAEKVLSKKEQTIILYCQTGARSKKAYRTLKKIGYTNLYYIKEDLQIALRSYGK